MHLKNSVGVGPGSRLRTALTAGEINDRHLLRVLRAGGDSGPLCIESPRSGDRDWCAREDLAYLQALLDEEGW